MTDYCPPLLFVFHDIEKSGAPKVTLGHARALAGRGWRVRLCFPARGGLEAEARAEGFDTTVVSNPAVSLAGARGRARFRVAVARLGAFWRFHRLCREEATGVVWVGSSVGVVAAVAGWLARRPVVVHVQEVAETSPPGRLRIAMLRKSARALLFVARRTREPFGHRPPGQLWSLLPNYVATPGETGSRHLRDEFGIREGDVVFLAVAFLYPHKGIDVLLDAFRRVAGSVPTAVLWIAGGDAAGEKAYADGLRDFVRKHGLEDRVRFLGYRDDVPRLLGAADVFVLASRKEALPLTVIEAMQAGRPVVATEAGSVRDMVAEGRTGRIVPIDDAKAMAGAMEEYALDDRKREFDGRRGRLRAKRLFDRERITDRAEAVLRFVSRDR